MIRQGTQFLMVPRRTALVCLTLIYVAWSVAASSPLLAGCLFMPKNGVVACSWDFRFDDCFWQNFSRKSRFSHLQVPKLSRKLRKSSIKSRKIAVRNKRFPLAVTSVGIQGPAHRHHPYLDQVFTKPKYDLLCHLKCLNYLFSSENTVGNHAKRCSEPYLDHKLKHSAS